MDFGPWDAVNPYTGREYLYRHRIYLIPTIWLLGRARGPAGHRHVTLYWRICGSSFT